MFSTQSNRGRYPEALPVRRLTAFSGFHFARAVVTMLLVLSWPVIACAHTGGMTGFATISISGTLVRYNLTLSDVPPGPLAEQMHLGQPGITPDFRPLITAISEKIHVTSDGLACAATEGRVVPPSATSVSLTGTVDFTCPDEVRKLAIRDDMSETLGSTQHTLAAIVWSGGSQQFPLRSRRARDDRRSCAARPCVHAEPAASLRLGIEHILSGTITCCPAGADVARGGLWSLLKIITAFTSRIASRWLGCPGRGGIAQRTGRIGDRAFHCYVAFVKTSCRAMRCPGAGP
jgi:hypothetical protein